MGVIKQLKKLFTGEQIFPVTKTNAVYDDTIGRLDSLLQNVTVNSNELEGEIETGLIRNLKNPFIGNFIFPVTKTRAIYNDDGSRLDKYLEILKSLSGNNILINSNFANPINQRGVVTETDIVTQKYWIDRWMVYSGSSTGSNSAVVNNGYITLNAKAGTKAIEIFQLVEFPERYAGKMITLSAKCRASAGTKFRLRVLWNDQTESVGNSVLECVGTGDWQTITHTVQLPANVTKLRALNLILGSYNGIEYEVLTSDVSIDIEWAKVELGGVVTPYAPRLYAEELQLCKRYYTTIIDSNVAYAKTDDVLYARYTSHLNIGMRALPQISINYISVLQNGTPLNDFTGSILSNAVEMLMVEASKTSHGLDILTSTVEVYVILVLDAEL